MPILLVLGVFRLFSLLFIGTDLSMASMVYDVSITICWVRGLPFLVRAQVQAVWSLFGILHQTAAQDIIECDGPEAYEGMGMAVWNEVFEIHDVMPPSEQLSLNLAVWLYDEQQGAQPQAVGMGRVSIGQLGKRVEKAVEFAVEVEGQELPARAFIQFACTGKPRSCSILLQCHPETAEEDTFYEGGMANIGPSNENDGTILEQLRSCVHQALDPEYLRGASREPSDGACDAVNHFETVIAPCEESKKGLAPSLERVGPDGASTSFPIDTLTACQQATLAAYDEADSVFRSLPSRIAPNTSSLKQQVTPYSSAFSDRPNDNTVLSTPFDIPNAMLDLLRVYCDVDVSHTTSVLPITLAGKITDHQSSVATIVSSILAEVHAPHNRAPITKLSSLATGSRAMPAVLWDAFKNRPELDLLFELLSVYFESDPTGMVQMEQLMEQSILQCTTRLLRLPPDLYARSFDNETSGRFFAVKAFYKYARWRLGAVHNNVGNPIDCPFGLPPLIVYCADPFFKLEVLQFPYSTLINL